MSRPGSGSSMSSPMSARVRIAVHGADDAGLGGPPLALEFHHRGSALYIRLTDEAATRTVELEAAALADYDKQGKLVGFELLGPGDPDIVNVLARLKRRFADEAPQLQSVEAIPA